MTFAQLTIRVKAAHKFAVYGDGGKLVAGNPEEEVGCPAFTTPT
jgi:hypothetical protein